MFNNFKSIFFNRQKAIQDEVALKSKVDEVLINFVKEEILKKVDLDYQLSYALNRGIIKIETDNKIIAQEIALRIGTIEKRLRKEGVVFRKVLV